MNIGMKLSLSIGLMTTAVIVVAIGLAQLIVSVDEEFEKLSQQTLKVTRLLENIRFSGLRIVSSTSEYLLIASIEHQHPGEKVVESDDQSGDLEAELIEIGIKDIDDNISGYRNMIETHFPDETEFLQSIEGFKEKLIRQSRDLIGLVEAGFDEEKILEHKEQFEVIEQEFLKSVEAALDHEAEEFGEKAEAIEETIDNVVRAIWAGLIGSALFVLIIGGIITRSITVPIRRLTNATEKVSTGNLSTRVDLGTGDEIGNLGRSFNSMADQLQQNEQAREVFAKQLEQKNTELEHFTYSVSHDLKSPLVTVKGFLGLLEKDLMAGDSERVTKDMQQITNATDRMGSLLDDLLELSRIGSEVYKPQIFSLSQLAEEVVFMLHGVIEESGAKIEFAADMPSVFADKNRINEVLQNLFENSVKFAGEGNKAVVSMSAQQRGNWVECRVQDNGIGIDPRYKDKVFGLFDRLEMSVEGTGVGLALVKRIIEVHEGRVWVESEGVGQGTQVCFTLSAPEESIQ